jgi:hypothetical protein
VDARELFARRGPHVADVASLLAPSLGDGVHGLRALGPFGVPGRRGVFVEAG